MSKGFAKFLHEIKNLRNVYHILRNFRVKTFFRENSALKNEISFFSLGKIRYYSGKVCSRKSSTLK